jgi:hypothetical protein
LQEFDIPYLRALLENDQASIFQFEEQARTHGYGPLAPCTFMASPIEQKQLCRECYHPEFWFPNVKFLSAYWHRKSDGVLRQGVLRKWNHKCTTTYGIYVPNDLFDCPQVLIVSRNPHSHAPPLPVKTPPAIVKCFSSLLLRLEWKLADATPRRLVLDSGFMQELRCLLGWSPTADFDPHLEDLHPSLGNLDHVRRLVNVMRMDRFPNGTGFDGEFLLLLLNDSHIHPPGAKLLADEQKKLPLERRYICCAETHNIPNVDSGLRLVVCMTSRMSQHLLSSKRLSIDTSFKRVRGWQEFEIESWDDDHMRCKFLEHCLSSFLLKFYSCSLSSCYDQLANS